MKISRRAAMAATASTALLGLTKMAEAADLASDKIPPRMPLAKFVKDVDLLNSFRRGVRRMKARPPSDPLSWFFQAAMHGVTLELVKVEVPGDPNLINVDQKKWWNQCPHFGQASANFLPWHRAYTHYFERILRVHTGDPRFSLPYWDYSDAWDKTKKGQRFFPEEFGRRKLNAELDFDISNPLYHAERNVYVTDWDHWSLEEGPYAAISELAASWKPAQDSPVFFGATDEGNPSETIGIGGNVADEDTRTRGRMESFPHDPIHRLVGGLVGRPPHANPDDPNNPVVGDIASGGMASPPTAGFDPIFCVHHSNIDRLWAEWSCMPGKAWGKFPPAKWFEESPWHFYDIAFKDGHYLPVEVAEEDSPRMKYFDYRALGISFESEDLSKTPLALPDPIPSPSPPPSAPVLIGSISLPTAVTGAIAERIAVAPTATNLSATLSGALDEALDATPKTADADERLFMRILGIDLNGITATGFEVYLTDGTPAEFKRTDPGFLGTIALFRHDGLQKGVTPSADHAAHGAAGDPSHASDVFDITAALRAAKQSDPTKLNLVIKPFSLIVARQSGADLIESSSLTFESIEFFSIKQS